MRPMRLVPASPAYDQVAPPSVLRKMPAPPSVERLACASPVPTQYTSGLPGSTATSPIASVGWSSNRGANVVPLFVVFQTPPEA